MKIASENAALALTQSSAQDAAAKRREAAEGAIKAKANALPRTIVDTVELSETKPAAQTSRSKAQAAQLPPEQLDPIAALAKSFGARAGDAGYDKSLDINADGVINFADLNAALNASAEPVTGGPQPVEPDPNQANPASITPDDADALGNPAPTTPGPVTGGPQPIEPDPTLANPASLAADDADAVAQPASEQTGVAPTSETEGEDPASFTAKDIELALAAFGSSSGDDAFNNAYDFDGDGTINFGDLNELLSRFGDQSQSQQTLIDQLTERFGATTGEKGFNANLDFDGDGTINFADLNQLLANLAQNPTGGQ